MQIRRVYLFSSLVFDTLQVFDCRSEFLFEGRFWCGFTLQFDLAGNVNGEHDWKVSLGVGLEPGTSRLELWTGRASQGAGPGQAGRTDTLIIYNGPGRTSERAAPGRAGKFRPVTFFISIYYRFFGIIFISKF